MSFWIFTKAVDKSFMKRTIPVNRASSSPYHEQPLILANYDGYNGYHVIKRAIYHRFRVSIWFSVWHHITWSRSRRVEPFKNSVYRCEANRACKRLKNSIKTIVLTEHSIFTLSLWIFKRSRLTKPGFLNWTVIMKGLIVTTWCIPVN